MKCVKQLGNGDIRVQYSEGFISLYENEKLLCCGFVCICLQTQWFPCNNLCSRSLILLKSCYKVNVGINLRGYTFYSCPSVLGLLSVQDLKHFF